MSKFRYNLGLMALDVSKIRQEFPYLREIIAGHPMVYLDTAATSQVPAAVLSAMQSFYETAHGNPHRGMHVLASRATDVYEAARVSVQNFIHAKYPEEIIFTRSATESINLVAKSTGVKLKAGDVVLVSVLEHHSNIVPWLQLKQEKGIDVRFIEITDDHQVDLNSFREQMKDGRVKLVAITGLSNVLGTRPPLQLIIGEAHAAGAMVLIDAAQRAAHMPIDVSALDCDFLAFSGHKIYGPTGIGVLYGKKELLNAMPPFLGGGMMIQEVTRDHFTTADLPAKFEAGTMPIAEAAGLKAAIDWQMQFDWNDRIAHERGLLTLAMDELTQIPGLKILGPMNTDDRRGCISFVIDGIHPHDFTDILGTMGICLRAGHHCAQPLHERLGMSSSARLSIGLHTTEDEIKMLRPSISDALDLLKK